MGLGDDFLQRGDEGCNGGGLLEVFVRAHFEGQLLVFRRGVGGGVDDDGQVVQAPPKRSPAHYLWAVLIARIYEVFPLVCPMCGGQMHLIAFITEGAQIRRILDHIGVDPEPPHISPARGPPLWDCGDAQMGEGVQTEPDWELAAQPAPDFEADQRVSW